MKGQTDRRLGRFKISTHYVLTRAPIVTRIMGLCAIYRAEHLLAEDVIEYWASCARFELLSPNVIIPEYVWIVTVEDDVHCERLPVNSLFCTSPIWPAGKCNT